MVSVAWEKREVQRAAAKALQASMDCGTCEVTKWLMQLPYYMKLCGQDNNLIRQTSPRPGSLLNTVKSMVTSDGI